MQGAAAARAQAPSSAGRIPLFCGGGRGLLEAVNLAALLGLIYCGPAGLVPLCRLSLGRRHDLTPRSAACSPRPHPRPLPAAASRPSDNVAKVGEGPPVGVRGPAAEPGRPARTRCGAPSSPPPPPLPPPSSLLLPPPARSLPSPAP